MFADLRAMDTKQDTFCQSVNNSHVPFLQKDLFCKTSFLQKKHYPQEELKQRVAILEYASLLREYIENNDT